MEFYHQPVLMQECLDYLDLSQGGTFVDCTLGGGGHSEAILQQLADSSAELTEAELVGLDRDHDALTHAGERLAQYANFRSIHTPFGSIDDFFEEGSVSGILMDLGISSRQIDDGSRGFSYKNSEFLDLRMDQSKGWSAREWILNSTIYTIMDAFKYNADMRGTKRFVDELKLLAEAGPVKMGDFKKLVKSKFPRLNDQDGLCARLLQAIRMELNAEMPEVESALKAANSLLKVGGRLVVITYHSVEDRVVKHTMKTFEQQCICPPRMPMCQCGDNHKTFQPLTRKPQLPSPEEVALNPRSRSAKLRVYERVVT